MYSMSIFCHKYFTTWPQPFNHMLLWIPLWEVIFQSFHCGPWKWCASWKWELVKIRFWTFVSFFWPQAASLKAFLGPRGPLVLPLIELRTRKKNLDHNIYRHTCLMTHQKSHQTNPMAQRDPIDAPLTPWVPVGLPLEPLGPSTPTPWPPGTL